MLMISRRGCGQVTPTGEKKHVERVIGTLKKRYKILSGTLSVSMIKHKNDKGVSNIDKLLLVCSALTNLGEPVISGCI